MANDVYERLADHFSNFPWPLARTGEGYEIEVLKHFFSEEEAEIACYIPLAMDETGSDNPPKSIQTIANETGRDVKHVEIILDALLKRAYLLFTEEQGSKLFYMFPFAPGIFEFTADQWSPETAKALDTYFNWRNETGFIEKTVKLPMTKVVPINKGVSAQTKVHSYEDIDKFVSESTSLCLMQCSCRTKKALIGEGCGRPLETCLFLNEFADYLNSLGKGRKVTKEEAFEMLEKTHDAGCIHLSGNAQGNLDGICSCCPCCCTALSLAVKTKSSLAMAKSDFLAKADSQLCTGCEECIDRCYFNAIEIVDGSAVIDSESCIGCGACAYVCPSEAITLERRDTVIPTPANMKEMLKAMR